MSIGHTLKSILFENIHLPIWNTITSRRPIGTNIFDRDWDILVILDACRVDALREVSNYKPWIGRVDAIRSVGSMSAEWVLNTFTKPYEYHFSTTAFVSSNPWTERILVDRSYLPENDEARKFHLGYPAWRPSSADAFYHYEIVSPFADQYQRVHPRGGVEHAKIDRAISVWRELSPNRMIVWLGPPHKPYYSRAINWTPGGTSVDKLMTGIKTIRELKPHEAGFGPAKRREVTREAVWDCYLDHLRFGLDYVSILLDNVNADTVVISSDHGEALGEFGIWSHPFGFPLAPVKTVPWMKTKATDENTYTPQFEAVIDGPDDHEIVQQLEDLGYG